MEDLYPTPLEIPIMLHTFLTFFGLTEPTNPKEFQSLLWREYGCFQELHKVVLYIRYMMVLWTKLQIVTTEQTSFE